MPPVTTATRPLSENSLEVDELDVVVRPQRASQAHADDPV
jgi:hypothetical protein